MATARPSTTVGEPEKIEVRVPAMKPRPLAGPSPFLKPRPAPAVRAASGLIQPGAPTAPSARSRAAQRLETGLAWVATALLAALLVYELIGIYPFMRLEGGSGVSADGDPRRRLLLLSMFAVALVLCFARPYRVLQLLKACWPILIVLGLMAASVVWSRFPDLTIRRTFVYWIYFTIAVAAVAWIRPADRFLAVCATTCAAALSVDLIATVVAPGRSWTPIGLAAIHLHKNMAGIFAFIALAFIGPQIFVARNPLVRLALAGLFVAGSVFLLLTQSKNSIGVFAITLVGILPALILLRAGRGSTALVVSLIAAALSAAFFISGALDLSLANWVELGSGDASFTGRTDLWRVALYYISEAPFVGDGFGAHWSVPDYAHPLRDKVGWWTGLYQLMLRYNQSHNGYLDLAIQLGLAGVIAVLVYLAALIVALGRIFRGTRETIGAAAPVYGVACLITGILLMNILESSLFFPAAAAGTVLLLVSVLVFGWSADLRAREARSARPATRPRVSRSAILR